MTLKIASIVLVIAGAGALANGVWIHAKATLAQVLLEMSWRTSARPWPWADTRAVAKLDVGGRSIIVLSGASGRTMAFGPGHLDGSAFPGQPGNCVITAHRDTHFAVLRDVVPGDPLVLRTSDGEATEYEVRETFVAGKNDTWLLEDDGTSKLTLITCYPFDAVIPGGPLRYVVVAEKQNSWQGSRERFRRAAEHR